VHGVAHEQRLHGVHAQVQQYHPAAANQQFMMTVISEDFSSD